MLSVIATMKENARLELDSVLTSDLSQSELLPLLSKLPTEGKIMQGQQEVLLRPLVTREDS